MWVFIYKPTPEEKSLPRVAYTWKCDAEKQKGEGNEMETSSGN